MRNGRGVARVYIDTFPGFELDNFSVGIRNAIKKKVGDFSPPKGIGLHFHIKGIGLPLIEDGDFIPTMLRNSEGTAKFYISFDRNEKYTGPFSKTDGWEPIPE